MLSLSKFAKNYELFENLFASNSETYDFDVAMNFFKLWDKKDLEAFMKGSKYLQDIKSLMDNIAPAKEIKFVKPILAKDVFMHMMNDQYYCCMAYLLGRNQEWLTQHTILSEETRKNILEISQSTKPVTLLSMHYGPYRCWTMFLPLFKQKFLVPHTENEYTEVFEKKGITSSDIRLAMVDDTLVQKLSDSYAEGRSIFLLADYSVSPRRSDRTATLFGNKIHAPSGSIRLAQKNNSPIYITRIKSCEPCHFEIVVDKIIGSWETNSLSSDEQFNQAVDQTFTWFTKTIEADPVPWQGWHRYKLILAEPEKKN